MIFVFTVSTLTPHSLSLSSSPLSFSSAMTDSKAVLASLLLLLLYFHGAEADELVTTGHGRITASSPQIDCAGACAGRCRQASRQKMCRRACGTCCYRCMCVPPGTSGHRDVCPCYAAMTTHGGRLKCP